MNKRIQTIPIAGFDTLDMKHNILHVYGKQSFGLQENLRDVLNIKEYGVECELMSPFDIVEEGKVTRSLQSNIDQDACNITEKIIIDMVLLLEQCDHEKRILIMNDILDNINKQEKIYVSKYYDEINKIDKNQISLSKLYKKHILAESIGYINKYYHKIKY